jgi:hypothetical protein
VSISSRRRWEVGSGAVDPRLATRQELAAAGYWFGPSRRRGSWGWIPVSWKVAVLIAVAVLAGIGAELAGMDERHDVTYAVPLLLIVVGICLWKSTAPGPSEPSARQLYEIARQQRGLCASHVTGGSFRRMRRSGDVLQRAAKSGTSFSFRSYKSTARVQRVAPAMAAGPAWRL